ncbi:MAG TPA: hypothetical protein VKU80_07750 [Planctomycetota bacterium]|nr:hypothetical protein [Planctomycetota bacterium]
MSFSLLQQLSDWIETYYHRPGLLPNLHCIRVLKNVSLPGGSVVSAVSVRHQTPRHSHAPDVFVAELWNLRHGPIRPVDIKNMCLALATFRAWYSEILEEAELSGLRRRHRFSVHGNLIGVSVKVTDVVDLLSHHGGEVAFWTYRVSSGRTEFDPYCGEGLRAPRPTLAQMLDHLAWEAPTDSVHASEDADSSIPI